MSHLHLGRDLSGKTIDLRTIAENLEFKGTFRAMVIDAATRKLYRRGAVDVIPPEE